jgi:hypothetical protein
MCLIVPHHILRLNGDLGEFVGTIYRKEFVPMKSQALEIAESLHLWLSIPSEDKILEQARIFLLNLADVMTQSKPRPSKLVPPRFKYTPIEGIQPSTSLALIRVKAPKTSILPYEDHVRAEARLAAALVHWLRESFGNEETIFVACPHRIQRSAVRQAILSPDESAVEEDVDELSAALEAFHMSENGLRIDTIERLQGLSNVLPYQSRITPFRLGSFIRDISVVTYSFSFAEQPSRIPALQAKAQRWDQQSEITMHLGELQGSSTAFSGSSHQ